MRDSRRVSIFAIILFEVLISTGRECEQVSGLVVSLPGGWYAMTQCPCHLILNTKKGSFTVRHRNWAFHQGA